MVRKIWLFALLTLAVTLSMMHFNMIFSSLSLADKPSSQRLATGWVVETDEEILSRDFSFSNAGKIRDQYTWSMTRLLPATQGDTVCFVSIGYQIEASLDNKVIYRFGDNLRGKDVWGVQTHFIPLPDGGENRTLSLQFSTDIPNSVALSDYILMDQEVPLIQALLQSNSIKILLPLTYSSIGIFLLLLTIQRKLIKTLDLPLLIVSLMSIAMGGRILANNAFIAYFTGPIIAYWVINALNMAIPLLILLLLAADPSYRDRRVLLALSALQAVSIAAWVLVNLSSGNAVTIPINGILYFLLSAAVVIILVREARAGRKHLETAVSLGALLGAVLINAHLYFRYGVQNTMDFTTTILTLPILILISGKVIHQTARKEEEMALENSALRREGDLMLKNYIRIEYYIEETRKLWHDIDKHLAVMKRLMDFQEHRELSQYLQKMETEVGRIKEQYLTSNPLVNAIFTDKIQEAEALGIQCQASLEIPEHLRISGSDLCSLLINMMDNALEACRKQPEGMPRFIHIRMKLKNDFLYVKITNSRGEESVQSADLGESKIRSEGLEGSVSLGKAHLGYGLKIIKSVAERYGGFMEYSQTSSSFSVEAALKNRETVS